MTPYIEGYGEPKPPRPIEILRPNELTVGFIIRHVETFLKEITEWEDYDDDEPTTKNAFNPIGFNSLDTSNYGYIATGLNYAACCGHSPNSS